MVQEAPATQTEAFAPPSEPTTTPQEVVESAASVETPQTEPPVEGEPKLTYDDWRAKLDADPDLKAAHEERETERVETERKELRKEEYRKFQGAIQPAIDQWAQNSSAVRQGIDQIAGTIQQAVADGTLDAAVAAKAIAAYNPQMYFEGTYWLLGKMGETVEDEPFANEFLGRLNRMAQGKPDPDFSTDLLKRLVEPTLESGYVSRSKYDTDVKKAREEGRRAALEDAAARERGKPENNPDLAPKGTGGKTDAELKLDPQTPVTTLMEIRARERAGG